jgi:hypothetical protein
VEPIARRRGPAISASAASPGFKDSTLQVSQTVTDRAVRERDPALLEDRSQEETGRPRRSVRAEATGRSFLKMMLLVALATGFAVFWVVHSLARQRAELSAVSGSPR